MNAMTQLPISLPEADRRAASRELRRRAAPTAPASVVRLPDWVFIPAAPYPAPEPPDLADGARHGAELLVLPSQTLPYASAVLIEPGRVPPRLPFAGEPPARELDKHGIDLALSIGRQAVERAKLSGVDRLICRALPRAFKPAAAAHSRTAAASVTDALTAACPVVTALAGACLAASQIGIRTGLSGEAAQHALHLALAINPDAVRWTGATEAGAAPTSTHQASAPQGKSGTYHGISHSGTTAPPRRSSRR